jgi:hypothetical protein
MTAPSPIRTGAPTGSSVNACASGEQTVGDLGRYSRDEYGIRFSSWKVLLESPENAALGDGFQRFLGVGGLGDGVAGSLDIVRSRTMGAPGERAGQVGGAAINRATCGCCSGSQVAVSQLLAGSGPVA